MKLIFDIGANQGNYTQELLNLYPGLQVVTVEANPNLANMLTHRFGSAPNVTVLNYAVTKEHGTTVPFYICTTADTISTVDLDWINRSRFSKEHRYAAPIDIDTTSLDHLIATYGTPDLIKVDVEGYELVVMSGLTKKANTICFEWAEEKYDELNETVKHLQAIGYQEFAFTIGDHYTTNLNYTTWKDCDIHSDIDVNRKQRWGMVWAI